MKVLHICSDFCYTKVHSHLYSELDKLGVEQVVFTYMRNSDFIGSNSFDSNSTEFVYRPILKFYHRIFYQIKLNDVYKSLKNDVDLSTIDIIHCSTLFSDAGVAYEAFKEFGIPYITGVRSTDVDNFMAYAPHTWMRGIKIINNASHLVFISQKLKDRFENKFLTKYTSAEVAKRTSIRPNGIDDFWLNNICETIHVNKYKILYVGSFIRRKRSIELARAVLDLKNKYPDISLTFIGSGGRDESTIKRLSNSHPEIIYKGAVKDIGLLMEIYRGSSLFALPSVRETFGLVYIEALTQGVPVLYTEGDGVDGLLSPEVGISVKPTRSKIRKGIETIFDNYPDIQITKVVDFSKFKWDLIAKSYIEMYELICHKNIKNARN